MLPESTISLTSMHQTTFLSPFWLKTKRGSVTKQNGYYKCCHWQFCFHIHNKLPSTVLLVWLLRSPIVSQLSCDGTAEPFHNPAKMDFYSWWSILQQISSKFSLVKANTKYSWQGCQEAQGTVTYWEGEWHNKGHFEHRAITLNQWFIPSLFLILERCMQLATLNMKTQTQLHFLQRFSA